jgi:hypothetical protein
MARPLPTRHPQRVVIADESEIRQQRKGVCLMPRAKSVKLSAEERKLLDRVDRLTDEGKEVTTDDLIAYCNIRFKIDPQAQRRALEEALVDLGLTNADLRRLLERAKARATWEH